MTPKQAYEKRYAHIDNGQHTWEAAPPHVKDLWQAAWTIAWAIAEETEREACAKVCDEMREHWSDYKDTALLNGDVELSNAASGEPRAAEFLAQAIRARGQA
jgi:hypothetical protein